jgi:hypothetical protein
MVAVVAAAGQTSRRFQKQGVPLSMAAAAAAAAARDRAAERLDLRVARLNLRDRAARGAPPTVPLDLLEFFQEEEEEARGQTLESVATVLRVRFVFLFSKFILECLKLTIIQLQRQSVH